MKLVRKCRRSRSGTIKASHHEEASVILVKQISFDDGGWKRNRVGHVIEAVPGRVGDREANIERTSRRRAVASGC